MLRAAQAENSTGKAQVSLIDELDRVCSVQMRSSPFYHRYKSNIHWCAALHSHDQECYKCPESFLTFSILNGLGLYVQSKYGRDLQTLNRQASKPLLSFAIGIGCTPRQQQHHTTLSANVPTVAMLLRAGLRPNEQYGGSTPWRTVLWHLSQIEEACLEPSWLDVCKLLLMHGADANAYVKTGAARNLKVSALNVVESAFTHLPHRLVEEVRTMILQQTALASSKRGTKRTREPGKDDFSWI